MKLFGFAGLWYGIDRAALHAESIAIVRAAGLLSDDRTSAPIPSFAAGKFVASVSGVTVALRGRPIWRTRSGWTAAAADPAATILQAYLDDDKAFLQRLFGPFALAILDGRDGRTLLAVDRMGVETLAWVIRRNAIVFSDSAQAVASFPSIRAEVRSQAMYDYLLFHMVPSPDSIYEDVHKLQPGTLLTFHEGRMSEQRYWMPAFARQASESRAELESALREGIEAAVRRCDPHQSTGAFLSGGLDSSSVAGMLGLVSDRPARTFSIGFGVESHDELAYARIANAHFGCDPTVYHVTPEDIIAAFPQIAAAYDEPFGNSSAVPTLLCAQIARQRGVTHLLAGDGGDELFGGNERYARQQVFDAWWRLPRWLRERLLEPLAHRIRPEHPFKPLRKFRSYISQARIRMPERLETWNFFYRTPSDTVFESHFLSSIDPMSPLRQMNAVYELPESPDLLDRMLHYDWYYTLANNDLRKVGTMCELAGVGVSYPLLDPEVIDISLRIPASMKIQGGELRSFYKRAMSGFLPRAVLQKEKHGFGLPFGIWLRSHAGLRELIFDHLDDLGRRGFIRPSFLQGLKASQAAGDAGYFGYAIWDLAMLEAWFKAHNVSRPQMATCEIRSMGG